MGQALDYIIPVALAVAGSFVGNPEIGLAGIPGGAAGGAAIGAGVGSAGINYSQTHNIGKAGLAGLEGGAGSFVGGNIANSLLPNLGSVGGDLFGASSVGSSAGAGSGDIAELGQMGGSSGLPWEGAGTTGAGSGSIASMLGSGGTNALNSALGTPISQIAGSYAGGDLAGKFAPAGQPSNRGNYPYVPTEAGAANMPASLNSMSSLTPSQQSSGLATQGVYGGGLGPQEQSYFGNLVNRQLMGSGSPAPLSSLSPIENSYLSNLGFGNEGNSTNLLEALSKWKPSA